MEMQHFQQLSEMEKVSAILQYGRLMAQNTEHGLRMFLYKMDAFYVSACYNTLNDDLTEIICFSCVSDMIPHYRKQLISIVHPAEREYNTPEMITHL